MLEINPRSTIDADVRLPGSKSLTHRALIASSLADGESLLKGALFSEDTLYTLNALRQLGVRISQEAEDLVVPGTGGVFPYSSKRKKIFLGNSGTSFRLLLSTAALGKGEYLLTGNDRMCQRPIEDLVRALNQLGVKVNCVEGNGCPPVLIEADNMAGGKVVIPGKLSSQFISSLLLSSPYAKNDIEIEVEGKLVSEPYVDLTIEVMERFGVSLTREGFRSFKIHAGQRYKARVFTVEGDVSNASYFWAAAAVTGGNAVTRNIIPNQTNQGDLGFLNILKRMGCHIEKGPDYVSVHGNTLSGIDVDMSRMPDLVPTLAAIALFAEGKTVIRNVSHLRHKESDRLSCVSLEWNRLGGRVEELKDGLVIHGECPMLGTEVDPHDDHRLAMSLAVVGLRVPGVRIKDENCVNKSFPGFWDLWSRL